jgi:uncharacterized protein YidB (DUF937 family)
MGLLDGILGAALGSNQVNPAGQMPGASGGVQTQALLQMAMQLLQQHGGIGGLANSFNQAGLGNLVSSWIGTGQNLPISPSQLTQVVGHSQMSQMASQLGVSTDQAGGMLAQLLPHVVDHLTPGGQVAAVAPSQDVFSSLLSALNART